MLQFSDERIYTQQCEIIGDLIGLLRICACHHANMSRAVVRR